jgi:outer membrane immunogenic protein
MNIKLLIASMVAMAACAAGASAADLGANGGGYKDDVIQGGSVKWSGFYVGVDLGYGAASGDITSNGNDINYDGESEIDGRASLRKSSASLTGLLGDITLGADMHIPNSRIVIGVFGDYTIGSVSGSVSSSDTAWHIEDGVRVAHDCGNESGKFSIDNQWKAGLRAGFLVSPSTLAYAKFGYSQADLSIDHSSTDGSGVAVTSTTANWSNPKLGGYVLGAGLETQVYGGLFVRAEYDYIAYGDNSFYSNNKGTVASGYVGTETSSVDLDEHIAKAGLVYKLSYGN